MAKLIVELRVPLKSPDGELLEEDPYTWIEQIEDAIFALDEGAEEYDDGEEDGEHYVFFLTGDDEAAVLEAATRLAAIPEVPDGAYALVTDDEAEAASDGRRVDFNT